MSTLPFEQWVADMMRDPRFRDAVRAEEPHYQALRDELLQLAAQGEQTRRSEMELVLTNLDEIRPFLRECGVDAWRRLRRLVGRDEAFELAHMPRNEAIYALRVRHGYTLASIGDVFGLTRERIRQLTPAGLWAHRTELVDWVAIRKRVVQRAMTKRDAWKQGRISRAWVREQFGEDVAKDWADVHRGMPKLEMILRYIVGLPDRDACLSWLNEQYYKSGKTYAELAQDLSSRRAGVSICTMSVHRNAATMGFSGYSQGRREDLDLRR